MLVTTLEPLSRTWLILASLPRSWLALAPSCMVMVTLPRSWQDLGKSSRQLAMDLGKDSMASNTGSAVLVSQIGSCSIFKFNKYIFFQKFQRRKSEFLAEAFAELFKLFEITPKVKFTKFSLSERFCSFVHVFVGMNIHQFY